ncbi:uncharacterized protein PAC_16487 [Phialocephala subalpina]|uniref:Uncharacterized protein n=1 Tax=Phialocephala subalpina TaxID=576137 RepID=A0A1L7XNT4_9HELO|nr:uncharacterized protein PAC_16487 [Phialocephala subalpina]
MVSPDFLGRRHTEVSSESSRRPQTGVDIDTSHFFPDFETLSPGETIQNRTPTSMQNSMQETPTSMRDQNFDHDRGIPDIQIVPVHTPEIVPEWPLSYVSGMEEIRHFAPKTRLDEPFLGLGEPLQTPSYHTLPQPKGIVQEGDYHHHRSMGSQDDLLGKKSLQPPPPIRQETRNWFSRQSDWWLREFSSCLFSLLCAVAIIIILKVYDGEPLSKLPKGITLNIVLALFTTLAKAGLMIPISEALGQLKWVWFKEERPLVDFETFDQASRGPIGSVKLLGTLRFRHLASIGAVISILLIATSPITQQIISYHERPILATSGPAAQAPRSDLFMAYSPLHGSVGVPDLSMQQAVKMGLFNAANESITHTAPSCPTGNCTWPDFSSLGICSKTANITSFLSVVSVPGNQSASIGYIVDNNVTLPNGAYLQAGAMGLNITTPPDVVDGLSVSPTNHSLAFQHEPNTKRTTISNHFIIYQNSNSTSQPSFGAIEVLLYWCVNTYSTSVQSGIASTNVTTSGVNIGSTNASIPMPMGAGTNGTYQQWGNLALNPMNSTANYTVNGNANAALTSYMALTWRGWYEMGSGGGYSSDAAMALSDALFQEPSIANVTGKAADDLQMAGIQNLTANVATSITNNIRDRKFVGDAATGSSFTTQAYVKVSWAWLSFLLVLLTSSFAFLLATIIKTRAAKVDVMRSSALATMCGLSVETKAYMGPIEVGGGTLAKAEGLRVRLQGGAMGWSLEGRGAG